MEFESTGIEASSHDARLSAGGGKGKTELVYVGFWRVSWEACHEGTHSQSGRECGGLRYSVLFLIVLVSSAGLVISALNMPDSEYAALTRETRTKHLEELAPAWYQQVQIIGAIWVYSEFAVLLTNRERRALHDFMAGTVVIRA